MGILLKVPLSMVCLMDSSFCERGYFLAEERNKSPLDLTLKGISPTGSYILAGNLIWQFFKGCYSEVKQLEMASSHSKTMEQYKEKPVSVEFMTEKR